MVDCNDASSSILTFLRKSAITGQQILVVCNFTPVPRQNYRVGVPDPGVYREILNTDSELWGGSNLGNGGYVGSQPISYNHHYHSLSITLPPLAVVVFESPT